MIGLSGLSDAEKIDLASKHFSAQILFSSILSLGVGLWRDASKIVLWLMEADPMPADEALITFEVLRFSGGSLVALGGVLFLVNFVNGSGALWRYSSPELEKADWFSRELNSTIWKFLAVVYWIVSIIVFSSLLLAFQYYLFGGPSE